MISEIQKLKEPMEISFKRKRELDKNKENLNKPTSDNYELV